MDGKSTYHSDLVVFLLYTKLGSVLVTINYKYPIGTYQNFLNSSTNPIPYEYQ